MPRPVHAPVLIGLLACVALLAGLARELNNQRLTVLPGGDPSAAWFSADPDGLYHTRRVARFLDEGQVAAEDDLLSYPDGARVPWPPYYTRALGAFLGPFAPEGPERAAWLERWVATLPMVFAVLTAIVLAAAAWRLGGPLAAGVAGGVFAWLTASFDYSVPGIGDHHAWATLWMAVMFALSALALDERASGTRALPLGVAAGVVGGLLVGSWVGGLVQVMIVQAALGWMILVRGRRDVPGLASFGLAFHLALALVLLPAVLASPWKDEFPWMIVNLSWFHLVHPLLGALVFVPLFQQTAGERAARLYPWIVVVVLAVLGLLIGGGVREGFAWAGRANTFMAYITESQPLLGGPIGGLGQLHHALGLAVFAVVPAWCWAAWQVFVRGRTGMLVWVVAVVPMLAQAITQRRFAEACGVPMAVVVGIGLAQLPKLDRLTSWRAAGVGLVLGCALQWSAVHFTVQRLQIGERYARGPGAADQRSLRGLHAWLGEHAPAAGDAVLAAWDQGHMIEWVAGRPTVATNFGSYVGAEAYLAPYEFFLAEDPVAAERILEEREAGHVLVHGLFSKDLEVMLRLLRPDERGEFVMVRPGQPPRPAPRWFGTMAARLMLYGKIGDPRAGQLVGNSLDFVRLVHVSPEPLRTPMPIPHTDGQVRAGWIWERVPGARVEARGQPGETLAVSLDVEYAAAGRRVLWSAGSEADEQGVARLRVPYSTDAPNGDGVVTGGARWSFGGREGVFEIPERAVLDGKSVTLP